MARSTCPSPPQLRAGLGDQQPDLPGGTTAGGPRHLHLHPHQLLQPARVAAAGPRRLVVRLPQAGQSAKSLRHRVARPAGTERLDRRVPSRHAGGRGAVAGRSDRERRWHPQSPNDGGRRTSPLIDGAPGGGARLMAVRDDVVNAIAGFTLFADLTGLQLDEVVHLFDEAWFGAVERVLRLGGCGSGLYLVLVGTAG